MARALIHTPTEHTIMEIGSMIDNTVKEWSLGLMELNTRDSGSKTSSKVKVLRLGLMEQNIRVNTSTVKSMASVNSIGPMAVLSLVSF